MDRRNKLKKSLKKCINKKCSENKHYYRLVSDLTEYFLLSSIKNYRNITASNLKKNIETIKYLLKKNYRYNRCINTKCQKQHNEYIDFLLEMRNMARCGNNKLLKLLDKIFNELYKLEKNYFITKDY